VLAGDPLRSIPGAERTEQALRSLDFLACVDVFESATSRHAHALLPAATWLERWDVALASAPVLQGTLLPVSGPVMAPLGQARTDVRILGDLAVALGLPGLRWRLARLPLDRWLPRPRFGLPVPRLRPGRWLSRNRLRLWDERVEDELQRLRSQPAAEPEGFVLVGRRRRLGHNSWLHGGQRSGETEAVAWLSPQDLAALGVVDGQAIEIRSEIGMLRIPVCAMEGLAPRTVVVPHGLPELNVNALIPAGPERIERVSGQLVMTGIPARVMAASPREIGRE
jgi:formate dehydrogenase